jgi:hypothetical protein
MANSVAKLLLLAIAGIYLWREVRTARARAASRPDVEGLAGGLLAPALVMTLAVSVNGLAMLQAAYVEHVMALNLQARAAWWLALDQLAVCAGTTGLMEIIHRALRIPLDGEPDAKLIGLRVQLAMYRGLFAEHLPAVLGLVLFVGVAGSVETTVMLACELLAMWGGTALLLRHLEKKRAGAPD